MPDENRLLRSHPYIGILRWIAIQESLKLVFPWPERQSNSSIPHEVGGTRSKYRTPAVQKSFKVGFESCWKIVLNYASNTLDK